MPLTLDQVQNLEALAKDAAPAAPVEAPTPAQDAAPDQGARTRKRRKPAAATAAAPVGDDAASQIVALQDELRAACAAVVDAVQARDALIERIGELCAK